MRTLLFLPALILAAAAGTAFAAEPGGTALYNHGVRNRVPGCASCHGADGVGHAAIPRLAGLPAPYLIAQLRAFRGGEREGAMEGIARNMTDGEIMSVADWLAAQTFNSPPPSSSQAANLTAGEALVTLGDWSNNVPACRDCHGPQLVGGGPLIPPLAGHGEAYLKQALTAFASGERPPGPLGLMGKIAARMSATQIATVAAYIGARKPWPPAIPRPATPRSWPVKPQDPEHFTPPPEDAMPNQGGLAQAIRLGEKIFDDTPAYAGKFTGNTLSCRNCHLDRGRLASSSPMWPVATAYPRYRAKNDKVNTLAMRLQGCFRFSQNGKVPPPADGPVIIALESYLDWLATGLPIGSDPSARGYPKIAAPGKTPDRKRGAAVYAAHCALCHGAMGQGRRVAGAQVFPALWGPQSFNWGAGMHQLDKAAAFIHANMPLGAGGSLSVQQAWDVAAWMDSQPRPEDPRYAESVEKTRKLYHADHRYDYYGQTINGFALGAPGTLAAWIKTHPAPKSGAQ